MTIPAINPYLNSTVQTQTQNKKPKYSPSKISGYCAIGAGIGSCIAANKKKFALHRNLAYLSGFLALAHIGVVEYFHHKYHNKKNKT